MLVNTTASPICPRCGGSVMSPLAWPAITIGGDVFLILCPQCGCVLGSINKQGSDHAERVMTDAGSEGVPAVPVEG